jgi:hypothetical protein
MGAAIRGASGPPLQRTCRRSALFLRGPKTAGTVLQSPIDNDGLATFITPLATRPQQTGRGSAVNPEGSARGTSSFTCTLDGLDHLVSEDNATLGIMARQGTYTAICGHLVYAAALASRAGPLCSRCAQTAQEIQASVTVPPDRHGARGRARLGRLLGLH